MSDVVGEALVLEEPLSLWGGIDPATGRVIEPRHPQHGASLTGRVVVMPAGRGSSSSASVLAEAVRLRTAPLAFVLGEPDLILSVGAAVAEELYGVAVPVVVAGHAQLAGISPGASVRIDAEGTVTFGHGPSLAG